MEAKITAAGDSGNRHLRRRRAQNVYMDAREKKAPVSRDAKSQNWNCVYAPCDVLEQGQWRMQQEKFELERLSSISIANRVVNWYSLCQGTPWDVIKCDFN
jgi:hypothetical protein